MTGHLVKSVKQGRLEIPEIPETPETPETLVRPAFPASAKRSFPERSPTV